MAENILLFQIGGEVRFALQISKLFIGCTALIIIAVIDVITINAITIIIIIKLFETDTCQAYCYSCPNNEDTI